MRFGNLRKRMAKPPVDDLSNTRTLVCQDFVKQQQAAREQGVCMGFVTVFLNRTGHRLPAGCMPLAVLKHVLRQPILYGETGEELTDQDTVFDLAGGEAFFTHPQGHQGF